MMDLKEAYNQGYQKGFEVAKEFIFKKLQKEYVPCCDSHFERLNKQLGEIKGMKLEV